jgi:hypothetical protein
MSKDLSEASMLNLRPSGLLSEFVVLNEIRIIFQFAEHTAYVKHNQRINNQFSRIESNHTDQPGITQFASIVGSTCGKTTPE